MAATSTYISLSASVLLEYQYRDQSSNTNEFTTTVAPWFLMENGHDDSIALFNNDNSTNLTGNVRTRMGTPTDPTIAQYGYLKLDQIIALNDYDPELTSTSNLPVTFNPQEVVAYDVIRIHLTQGFNYENQEGFQFRLSFTNNDDKIVRYMNLAYRKEDNYSQINPSPFLFGGKYYASYIELKVPALYNLVDEFYAAQDTGQPTINLPSGKLSGGSGPKRRSLIDVEFAWIPQQKVINGQTYFNSYEWKTINLPTLDQFADLSAVVQEATDGDYWELYAAWNNVIIDNFINQLNDIPGNDYLILHELKVLEYLWPTGGSQPTFVQTGNLEFVQDSDYANPIPYRPIIQNPAAIAYRLEYTIRLFNRADNSSIWKFGSQDSNDVSKYAKYLKRINLGVNPIQPKIYNKIVDKGVNFFGSNETGSALSSASEYAKFVTSFYTTNNIILSSENAFIQTNPTTNQVELTSVGNSLSETIYAQGLARIQLTSSDTFIKFVIYTGSKETYTFLDLTGLGTITLNFFNDSGEIKSYKNFETESVDQKSGEIVFKIPSKDSQRISEYQKRQFTISANNGESDSQLYSGTFQVVGSENQTLQERKIESLEKKIKELDQTVKLKDQLIESEQNTVKTKQAQLVAVRIQKDDLAAKLQVKIQENEALLEDDELDEAEKNRLKEEIAGLESANQAAQIELANKQVIVVDPSCPKQRIDARDGAANVNNT